MGNAQTARHVPNAEFIAESRRFSTSELEELQKLFSSLAAQSRSEGQYVIASVFQAYFGIHGALGGRLFDVVTQMRKDQRMYFDDLVISKAKYEKGSPHEVENFMYQLLDLTGDVAVQRDEVEAVVLSILETVLGPSEAVVGDSLLEQSVQGFVNAATFSRGDSEACLTVEEFRKWCGLVPSVKKFLGTLMSAPSRGMMVGWQVPKLFMPDKVQPSSVVLRREHAWHISGMLQLQEANEWMLCYHSSFNGLSFNTFLSSMSAAKGPSILVVRDQVGHVYGGYASQAWDKHSDFYGDLKSFLFTLQPVSCVYRPTGSNTNIQWCAFGFTSDSIPNGIGFGGQIHHFGLFLSSSFDRGRTLHSVTFNNPALSERSEIVPDVIECWAVIVKGEEERDNEAVKGTILERFKEERNMLNLVGIANASS